MWFAYLFFLAAAPDSPAQDAGPTTSREFHEACDILEGSSQFSLFPLDPELLGDPVPVWGKLLTPFYADVLNSYSVGGDSVVSLRLIGNQPLPRLPVPLWLPAPLKGDVSLKSLFPVVGWWCARVEVVRSSEHRVSLTMESGPIEVSARIWRAGKLVREQKTVARYLLLTDGVLAAYSSRYALDEGERPSLYVMLKPPPPVPSEEGPDEAAFCRLLEGLLRGKENPCTAWVPAPTRVLPGRFPVIPVTPRQNKRSE